MRRVELIYTLHQPRPPLSQPHPIQAHPHTWLTHHPPNATRTLTSTTHLHEYSPKVSTKPEYSLQIGLLAKYSLYSLLTLHSHTYPYPSLFTNICLIYLFLLRVSKLAPISYTNNFSFLHPIPICLSTSPSHLIYISVNTYSSSPLYPQYFLPLHHPVHPQTYPPQPPLPPSLSVSSLTHISNHSKPQSSPQTQARVTVHWSNSHHAAFQPSWFVLASLSLPRVAFCLSLHSFPSPHSTGVFS